METPVDTEPQTLTAKEQECRACGHPRKVHSRVGCLNNGACDMQCTVKYMDKDMFH
jgi:hypothetical protein